jgi:hypothetical protein
VDVFLPLDAKVAVELGVNPVGGKTILATI